MMGLPFSPQTLESSKRNLWVPVVVGLEGTAPTVRGRHLRQVPFPQEQGPTKVDPFPQVTPSKTVRFNTPFFLLARLSLLQGRKGEEYLQEIHPAPAGNLH